MERHEGGSKAKLLARLSRRTTGGRYIPVVDGLRFVAIMLVLIFHAAFVLSLVNPRLALHTGATSIAPAAATAILPRLVAEMRVGVQVFFMVSGFVLSLPYIRARQLGEPRPSLRRYFLRRVSRIEPPYVVVMTLLFLGSLLIESGHGFGHYLAGLAYVHVLWFGTSNPWNAVTWSLEVEVQFYVIVPLLAMALCAGGRFARRQTILLVAVIAIVAQVVEAPASPHLFAFLGNYLQFFMVGWLLGDVYVTDWAAATPEHWAWDVVTLLGWPALLVELAFAPPLLVLTTPILILALGLAAFCGPLTRRALSTPWVATIGGMCYSIYLTHEPLMIAMKRWLVPVSRLPYAAALALSLLIMLPVVLLVGGLFFALVERPCMDPDWPRRISERLRLLGLHPSRLQVIPVVATDELTPSETRARSRRSSAP